jgi:hypothetical protein
MGGVGLPSWWVVILTTNGEWKLVTTTTTTTYNKMGQVSVVTATTLKKIGGWLDLGFLDF